VPESSLTAIAWNLFHGRDFPPDRDLFTWRSRLLRITERDETHVQVNRDLLEHFGELIGSWDWDVALLQETPPRYERPLAAAAGAEPHRVLTSRNSLAPLRRLAAWLNPDLIASGEGGSNLTLVRPEGALGPIVERRGIAIHEGRPERRAMALTRTESGICVANLHATNDIRAMAREDVLLAARAADEFAAGEPLIFGGDLNLRPARDPTVFERLAAEHRLEGATGPNAIDHLFARGLARSAPTTQLEPEEREVAAGDGRAIRLSDHAPVVARFETAR
jgi:hypothetical protein